MRFLHTADWHLGKRLHGFSLHDVQKEALEALIGLVGSERPDAVVVAGDVFDTQVPQVGALQLWELAVDGIVADQGVPMVVIPGNHDHAERLGVHAGISRRAGLHFVKSLRDSLCPVSIAGVDFYGVPFHKPVHVNSCYGEDAPGIGDFDYAAAMRYVLERLAAVRAPERPSVLIGHAFVEGAGDEPDGEDAIQVGGAGSVPAGLFSGFDYVALGHIHGERRLGVGHTYYSGSIYPYSFAEAGRQKSVKVIDIEPTGEVRDVRTLPLEVSRGLRVIEGKTFEEVLEEARVLEPERRRDYTLVRVSDRDPLDRAVGRLREWYPRAVLEQPEIVTRSRAPTLQGDYRTITSEDAFRQFFAYTFDGAELSGLEEELLREALAGDAQLRPERDIEASAESSASGDADTERGSSRSTAGEPERHSTGEPGDEGAGSDGEGTVAA